VSAAPFPPPAAPESRRTRWRRRYINLVPALRFAGARVTHYAGDASEIRAELRLGIWNRNVVGTIFGGALYTVADPFYMLLLIDRLGAEHVVWDKAATIRFLKPGRGTLFARFVIEDSEVEEIHRLLEHERSVDRVYRCELVDASGEVHAEVDKVVYIRRRDPERDAPAS
jgi:acyl-coenzyme A thioesterase PaaI-like protein